MHVFLVDDGWHAGGPGSSCTMGNFLSLFLLNHLTLQLTEIGGRNQEEAAWLLKDTELVVYLISHMKAFPVFWGFFLKDQRKICAIFSSPVIEV